MGGRPPVYGFKVVRSFPHDPEAFTQGLFFSGGHLYEGTGLNGKSSLRKIDLNTGKILQVVDISREYFGEGIALVRNRIVQLTWRSRKGFVYEKNSFRRIGEFHYETEGWGITFDGHYLIMSDGTAVLRFLDPKTFTVMRSVNVTAGEFPVGYLNELEFIRGEVYANVWGKDLIAIIAPATGRITGWIDLTGLRGRLAAGSRAEVLNGIAYDERHSRLFVTGKFWPKVFEIRIFRK